MRGQRILATSVVRGACPAVDFLYQYLYILANQSLLTQELCSIRTPRKRFRHSDIPEKYGFQDSDVLSAKCFGGHGRSNPWPECVACDGTFRSRSPGLSSEEASCEDTPIQSQPAKCDGETSFSVASPPIYWWVVDKTPWLETPVFRPERKAVRFPGLLSQCTANIL